MYVLRGGWLAELGVCSDHWQVARHKQDDPLCLSLTAQQAFLKNNICQSGLPKLIRMDLSLYLNWLVMNLH